MAFAAGKPDNGVTRDYVLSHIADISGATDLPVNADFEAGFGATPEDVFDSAKRCIAAGVAGFSIEDYTNDARAPFYAPGEAVERLRAARAAIDASGERVLLVARTEVIWAGHPDGLKEALRRLASFAEAGADVLFAPGLKTAADVAEVVKAAGPKPVNVVVGAPIFTVRQLEDLGVRRISVGAGLARAAWGGFMRAARDIAEHGRFDAFADAAPSADAQRAVRRLTHRLGERERRCRGPVPSP